MDKFIFSSIFDSNESINNCKTPSIIKPNSKARNIYKPIHFKFKPLPPKVEIEENIPYFRFDDTVNVEIFGFDGNDLFYDGILSQNFIFEKNFFIDIYEKENIDQNLYKKLKNIDNSITTYFNSKTTYIYVSKASPDVFLSNNTNKYLHKKKVIIAYTIVHIGEFLNRIIFTGFNKNLIRNFTFNKHIVKFISNHLKYLISKKKLNNKNLWVATLEMFVNDYITNGFQIEILDDYGKKKVGLGISKYFVYLRNSLINETCFFC